MTTDTIDGLGNRLRELRFARGWSSAELSRRTGIHRVMISKLENGHQHIQLSHALLIAEAFDISLDLLCNRDLSPHALVWSEQLAIAWTETREALKQPATGVQVEHEVTK